MHPQTFKLHPNKAPEVADRPDPVKMTTLRAVASTCSSVDLPSWGLGSLLRRGVRRGKLWCQISLVPRLSLPLFAFSQRDTYSGEDRRLRKPYERALLSESTAMHGGSGRESRGSETSHCSCRRTFHIVIADFGEFRGTSISLARSRGLRGYRGSGCSGAYMTFLERTEARSLRVSGSRGFVAQAAGTSALPLIDVRHL